MKTKILKKINNDRGFTLIEVLVTVAVTGILTTLASVIFINTVRNSKKAEITSEARQNAALVIDRLQKDARQASSMATNAGGSVLTLSGGSSGTIIWECEPPTLPPTSANGFISRNGLTLTNKDPIDGVNVATCSFSPPNLGSINLVTVNFNITEGVNIASGPQEYQVNLPFRSAVTTRGF